MGGLETSFGILDFTSSLVSKVLWTLDFSVDSSDLLVTALVKEGLVETRESIKSAKDLAVATPVSSEVIRFRDPVARLFFISCI